MTRSDSFDLLRTWRLYTSMKMRSASSTVWPWRSTSAIRVLTYFNAGIAFSSIIAFPPSAVSEPLRAIRSVERSTYDVLANIFTQTIAAQKRNGELGQQIGTALQKSGCVPRSGNFPNPDFGVCRRQLYGRALFVRVDNFEAIGLWEKCGEKYSLPEYCHA